MEIENLFTAVLRNGGCFFSWEEDSGMKEFLELYSDGFYGCRRMAGLVYGRL